MSSHVLLGGRAKLWVASLAASRATRLRCSSTAVKNYDGEFTGPSMKTGVPGPRSKELHDDMRQIKACEEVVFFTDYQRSCGNYIVDADGNVMLDLFQQISSLPLGYNNAAIHSVLAEPDALISLVNRPALACFPSVDLADRTRRTLLSIAPAGLGKVTNMMCGTCSNENAFKAAFIRYMNNKRGGPVDVGSPMYKDAIMNTGPGCPSLSILSFEKGFHGRAFGTLSCTHTKVTHKIDIPALDWPIAPFPQLRYPLDQYHQENQAEEQRCLEEVEERFLAAEEKECPVAAAIVEPIQAEGGDRHATPAFFKGLQAVCKKHGASLIIDEVQTGGGATGHMWAHESWGLPEPPDYVTFAKKMMAGGFYFRADEVHEGYRIFNTWVGDHARLVILEAVLQEIQKAELLKVVQESGQILLSGLQRLESTYPQLIMNARGQGTFCAIDCPNSATRDALLLATRNRGFLIGGSGDASVRFRPALILQPSHVNMFLENFDRVLSDMK